MDAADLSLFAHVVGRPERELDLGQAALLVAEGEYPRLEIARYGEKLDELGARARSLIAASPHQAPMSMVLRLLYGELGFRGNEEDYYDPRNSFLNDVIDRRRGIPITLAVVLIEVCNRAGVEAKGVSFPGHFLVRTPGPAAPIFIDPFDGRVLDALDLQALYTQATGDRGAFDHQLLEPAAKTLILLRMLNNLRGIYQTTGDQARLRSVLLRMMVLSPSDALRQQLQDLDQQPPPRRTSN